MSHYLAKFLGTALLVFLGDSVTANMVLSKTKSNGAGWLAIVIGWAMAVAIPVFIFGPISGGHFNPAVTIGFAAIGLFPWNEVIGYVAAQMLGGFVGGILVYINFKPHFNATEDRDLIRAVFCTGPAIRDTFSNFLQEFIGTFVLVFAVLGFANSKPVNGLSPIIVGLIILTIGLAYGGTTGFAINPARDLGPRIVHFLIPIKNKEGSDWWYAWIPVVAPICGGVVASLFFKLIF